MSALQQILSPNIKTVRLCRANGSNTPAPVLSDLLDVKGWDVVRVSAQLAPLADGCNVVLHDEEGDQADGSDMQPLDGASVNLADRSSCELMLSVRRGQHFTRRYLRVVVTRHDPACLDGIWARLSRGKRAEAEWTAFEGGIAS